MILEEFPGFHILFLEEKTLACLIATVKKGLYRFVTEKPTFRIIGMDFTKKTFTKKGDFDILTWNQALEKDNKPGVKYLKY
jgi:hypothetical protein